MRHHTEDPAKRAEHIADHVERQLAQEAAACGREPYRGWPRPWLDAYGDALREWSYAAQLPSAEKG